MVGVPNLGPLPYYFVYLNKVIPQFLFLLPKIDPPFLFTFETFSHISLPFRMQVINTELVPIPVNI